MQQEKVKKSEKKKPCANCGAELKYKPGSQQLACEYCGYEEFIEQSKNSLEELELSHYLQLVGTKAHTETISLLHCKNCGANQHVEENYKSLDCVYCGEPLILEDASDENWILPGAVLPFKIDKKKAHCVFSQWISNVWFAPNKLKRAALSPEGLFGLYVPYWTFDCDLTAKYRGMRGEYYYVTERYKTSKGVKTRNVRKTRWYNTSGKVNGFIDDILVNASLKKEQEIPNKIARWNLKELQPFDKSYLSGFVTEKYSVSLKDGHRSSFAKAKKIAYQWIRKDIGGDTQQIHSTDIKLQNETFKHILLPMYISTYRFKSKEYYFYINGQTGVISGKYPISFWKVFLLVLIVLAFIAIVTFISQS